MVDLAISRQVASIYTLAKVPVVDDRVSTAGLVTTLTERTPNMSLARVVEASQGWVNVPFYGDLCRITFK